jgi:riboflavin biosynthesis pyrimidine reductase
MRPYIICHMITSLDGKITAHNDHSGTPLEDAIPGFNVYYDLEEKLGGQGWMCGRSTFELFSSKSNELLPEIIDAELPEHLVAIPEYDGEYSIAVDTKGKLRWDDNMVHGKYHLIYVVTKQTPKAFIQYLFNKKISYITAGNESVDFNSLFKSLTSKFGITKLRLEGGGKLNGSIYSAGLIDEISIVLSPLVINNPLAPAVFENTEVDINKLSTQFGLYQLEKLENDLVWLRYKKLNNSVQ